MDLPVGSTAVTSRYVVKRFKLILEFFSTIGLIDKLNVSDFDGHTYTGRLALAKFSKSKM